jgi:16S rRNA (uracil1498-N3)-methyltransferase
MRRSRFFVDPSNVDLTSQTISITEPNQIKQILTVLRLRVGDTIDILDGIGNIYPSVISTSTAVKGKIRSGDRLSCKFESSSAASGESRVRFIVALPILRNTRFEWALEKLTELGVAEIVPIILERSVVAYDSDQDLSATKFERWHSIVREAAEQSERALIPNVVSPEKFAAFVKRRELSEMSKFIGAERADAPSINDALDSADGANNICIAIGAEGGFTESEFALSFTHGFRPISLGQRILRAETAAVYAASVVVSRLDK